MTTKIRDTKKKRTPAITCTSRGEILGVESVIFGNAYLYSYTIPNRWDNEAPLVTFEVSNERGTVGGMLYHHFVQYVGALQDAAKENTNVVEASKRSLERIEEWGSDFQLYVIPQIVHRIEKENAVANSHLEKCYIYADIVLGKIRA
jgi:hypothetical protein